MATFINGNDQTLNKQRYKEVAEEAFTKLGNAGMIEPGKAHSCSQCSQPYKAVADFMVNEDPEAVIGVNENSAVPVLKGQYARLSADDTAQEQQAARIRANNINNSVANDMDVDYDNCTMIVMDGIVLLLQVIRVHPKQIMWLF